MRTWFLAVAVVLLPVLGWAAAFSAPNPAVRNPIGAGTVPVSSYRDGLVTTPVPVDATADLSMTGNVREGKYFRGNVPYRSTSEIGSDPGSSSLNSYRSTPSLSSFLRDSAGPEDFARHSPAGYGARPYYSVAEAVARTVPGGTDVLAPQGAGNGFTTYRQWPTPPTNQFALEAGWGQNGRPQQETTVTAPDFHRFQTQPGLLTESLSTSDGTFIRSMSPGPEDVERLTPGQAATLRRQDDRLLLQRLRELSGRTLSDLGEDSGMADHGASVREDSHGLERGGLNPSGDSLTDGLAARYRLSRVDAFEPSADSRLLHEPVDQSNGRLGTAPAPMPGRQDDFVEPQTHGARTAPGYALPSQETVGAPGSSLEKQDESLGRIRQQLEELSRSVESLLQAKPGSVSTAGVVAQTETPYLKRPVTLWQSPNSRQAGGSADADVNYVLKAYEPLVAGETPASATSGAALGETDVTRQNHFVAPTTFSLEAAQRVTSLPDGMSGLSQAEISAEARRIMGSQKSPDLLAADKFSQHLRAGEDYLKAGRYYKAVNSFALASMYRLDDPQALAGRSHALFAAGEYISSALFLSRALVIEPEYAKRKVDFVMLMGGSSRLAGRIADAEQWLARSGSGQLQLLLGYVYYQTGRTDEARRAIDIAREKMPQSSAAIAIKAAIDDISVR